MQFLYANPDPATKARANLLGCGWVPAVPLQFTNIATAPCVILAGAGLTVIISDAPPTTATAVAAAAVPIQSAEAAAAAAQATLQTNHDTLQQAAITAITANQTFLAVASPTTAQVASQVKALTRQINALIRIVTNQLDSTAGS